MIIESTIKVLLSTLDKVFEPTLLTAVEALKMRGHIKLNIHSYKLLKKVKIKRNKTSK